MNRGRRRGEPREIVGKAKLKHPKAVPAAGELRVSFFGPFYSDYRIIELAPDYSYAVVTGSDKRFLWILAREPVMPENRLRPILERLAKLGFDVGKLEYPEQPPESPGK